MKRGRAIRNEKEMQKGKLANMVGAFLIIEGEVDFQREGISLAISREVEVFFLFLFDWFPQKKRMKKGQL